MQLEKKLGGEVRAAKNERAPVNDDAAPACVLIEARGRWEFFDFREFWRFRELLYFLAMRDVKVRYKQTALGAAWAVLQPLSMMLVFMFLASRMGGAKSAGIPYPLFVFAGLLPWIFFANAIGSAGNSVVGSERLITKVYFCRLIIPFAAVFAVLVDMMISMVLLSVLMLYYGHPPGAEVLLLPLMVVAIVLAALGIGTFLAALNVRYRDVRHALPFLTQVWMFATPSVYTEWGTGAGRWDIFVLNPLAALIAGFRAAALGLPIPWLQVCVSLVAVSLICVVGCWYFRRTENNFADLI